MDHLTERDGRSARGLASLGGVGIEKRLLKVEIALVILFILLGSLFATGGSPLQPSPSTSHALVEPITDTFQYGYLGYTGVRDTYINQWFPDTNYGWYNTMSIRPVNYASSLLFFDLTSIPAYANVISAQLGVWCTGTGGQTVDVCSFRVLRQWVDSQATWNIARTSVPWGLPGCDHTITDRTPDFESLVTVLAESRWYTWTLTSMVQTWVASPSLNQGVILKGYGNHFVQFAFASSEYWNKDLRPRLKVTYLLGPLPTSTPTISLTPTVTPWQTWTPTRTPTPSATPGDVYIRIVPNNRTVLVGEVFTLDVMIEAPVQPVDSAAVYIDYDPVFLIVVDEFGNPTNQVIPGPALPAVFQNNADNGLGDVNYVAGAALPPVPPPVGTFLVATIRFKALAQNAGGTGVTFVFNPPRRTLTLYEGVLNLRGHTNGLVYISSVTPTPTATGPTPTRTRTPTATSTLPGPTPGNVTVYIDPAPKVVCVNEVFTVYIRVNELGQPVDSGSVYVDFDPSYLRVVDAAGNPTSSIIPGGDFSAVFENAADNAAGTINYQAGIPSGPPPCASICTMATIRLKALAPTGGTPLAFHTTVPRRTRMILGGVTQNTSVSSGLVIIGAATPTHTATPAVSATRTPTRTATPTGSPLPGVSILLDPGLKIATVGEIFDLHIRINAGAQPVDGAQAYVNFNPAYLQVLSVIPDLSVFPDIVAAPTWDNAAGHVGYAAGILIGTPATGNFRIATIRFFAAAPVGGTVVSFAFHPPFRDTNVTYQGARMLGGSVNSIILIMPAGAATATPTVTGAPTATPTPTVTPTRTATPTLPTGPSGTVVGRVILEGRSNHSGAVVTVGGRSATTAANGTFTITGVPVGVHTARASKMSYLYSEKPGVLVTSGGTTTLPDVGLYGGDCSGDGIVDLFDMVIVGMAYEANPSSPHWDPRADINGDNVVNLLDLVIIGTNFEKTAPTPWTMW